MRLGHHQAPAVRADALDVAGDVTGLVLPILKRALLVAEHQRAEEDLAYAVVGEDETDVTLGAAQLVESLEAAFGLHSASEGRISHVVEIACLLGPELQ